MSNAFKAGFQWIDQRRCESARAWVASGALVSVKAVARRYGVDCYTAYADLIAIGVRLAAGDNRWAVRPTPAAKRPPAEPADFDEGWVWIGEQRMFVVGCTSGSASHGWIDNRSGGAEDRLL